MAKIEFTKLNLKKNTEVKTFDFQGQKFEVLQYLPTEDKYDLVMITLQQSKENGYYNPLKIDMFFHLNIMYLYTNIEFTEEEKQDPTKLFDIIESSGLLEEVIKNINSDEYDTLRQFLLETRKAEMDYNKTIGSIISKIIYDLPKNAEAATKFLQDFEPEKYQNVMNFVKAANGGRDIKFNNLQPAAPDNLLSEV